MPLLLYFNESPCLAVVTTERHGFFVLSFYYL